MLRQDPRTADRAHDGIRVDRVCSGRSDRNSGAGKEARTPDLNLGKVALYQLSYSRDATRPQQRRNCRAGMPRVKKKPRKMPPNSLNWTAIRAKPGPIAASCCAAPATPGAGTKS